jgi:hypothetical protein
MAYSMNTVGTTLKIVRGVELLNPKQQYGFFVIPSIPLASDDLPLLHERFSHKTPLQMAP